MTEATTDDEIPRPETPDAHLRKIFTLYGEVLIMTIRELHTRGYHGWGAYLEAHFLLLDDIFGYVEEGTEDTSTAPEGVAHG